LSLALWQISSQRSIKLTAASDDFLVRRMTGS
jgi:hypothetical protein